MADESRPNVYASEVEYDAGQPKGYRAGMVTRPGPQLGAQATGLSVYEIPPGESICPYHYERAEEEWLVVLEGRATVRRPASEEELGRGDIAFFTNAPEGAHKVTNRTDENLRVLMFSDLKWPAVSVYPDSDKIGVYASRDRKDNVIVPRSADVDYYDGEPIED